MKTICLAVLFGGLSWSLPVLACAIPLRGEMVQGGLVIGRVPTKMPVYIGETKVRVSTNGLFVFGFGRDAPTKVTLRAGQDLCSLVVRARNYKTTRINGLPQRKVMPRNPTDLKRIREDNSAIRRVRRLNTALTDFASGFQWPVNGRISGKFGSRRILNGIPRRAHNGIDIAAPPGTIVRAPAFGRIALVHRNMFLSGKTVMIDHGHGLTSVYIHMSLIKVEEGQRVKPGDEIGQVGMTGRATGPHLHWGVSWFQTHLDPALLVGATN